MPTSLATVAELAAALSQHGIPYWIFGGFAVDLHVGEATRPHSDVDIAVLHDDFSHAVELLAVAGFTQLGGDHRGYAALERAGERVDLASVARHDAAWPPGAFGDDVGEVGGVHAHVITRAALIADKREHRDDPETRAKDAADVRRLTAGR